MNRFLIAALATWALFACKKSPKPQPEGTPTATTEVAPPPRAEPLTAEQRRWTWEATSSNGRVMVTQTSTGTEQCSVQSTGAAKDWESDACLGESTQLHFVSNDGNSVVTVEQLPTSEGWKYPAVVWLAMRGEPTKQSSLGSFLGSTDQTKAYSTHLAWLAGTHEIPGARPQVSLDEKAVELTTVEGRLIRLSFDGSDWPEPLKAPPPTKVAAGVAGCSGSIRWTNQRGQVTYTDSLASVPKRFRKTARCTNGAEIGVVDGAMQGTENAPAGENTSDDTTVTTKAPAKRSVYCAFGYATYEKSTREVTNIAPSSFRERSFCASGTLEEAQRECEKTAAGFRDATACRCTNDPGTRCH